LCLQTIDKANLLVRKDGKVFGENFVREIKLKENIHLLNFCQIYLLLFMLSKCLQASRNSKNKISIAIAAAFRLLKTWVANEQINELVTSIHLSVCVTPLRAVAALIPN